PEIFLAIEAGRAHPVLQSEVVGVLDAKAALFRRINQKKSAERPERLASEALLAFLVQQNDALAGVGDLGGRHQPRQTAADPNYGCIISHRFLPRVLDRMKPVTFVAVNGKTRLPVAAAPRRNLLTVPVWDLLPPTVQRGCNTAFEFGSSALGPLDKKAVRQHG